MQFDVHRSSLEPAFPAGVVLRALGDLDMAGVPRLRSAVVSEVDGGTRLLVLDLTGVDHLDSAGLGAVIGALRRLRTHNGDLRLVCPEPRLRRVFEACDLDRVLELHDDVDAAVGQATIR
ncbi:MAG: STAS domain-containing protein [Actinomycetota bacterium]|nr:STAS domain-containing protein [Actinomycetota bacterium]MEC9394412.1 STAS domain-containing protein [Actinomycetota bacterium]MED6328062.1 STAS domain-containing protein [Actinomycetota bacterium]MEE2957887.1 STAS domain-containing protein [Actinomycetota bacterium]